MVYDRDSSYNMPDYAQRNFKIYIDLNPEVIDLNLFITVIIDNTYHHGSRYTRRYSFI